MTEKSITRGSGNVFADLGLEGAGELQAKTQLAVALNRLLDRRKLTQADTARMLGLTQPKVSLLRRYKLDGFSVEKLMTLLNSLDRDVEIIVKPKPRSRANARILVRAA